MRTKSEAHEALSLLHKRDGVPNIMAMDGAREQVHWDFHRMNREVGTHVKQTEPHLRWMNAAEGATRELKKGHGTRAVPKGIVGPLPREAGICAVQHRSQQLWTCGTGTQNDGQWRDCQHLVNRRVQVVRMSDVP